MTTNPHSTRSRLKALNSQPGTRCPRQFRRDRWRRLHSWHHYSALTEAPCWSEFPDHAHLVLAWIRRQGLHFSRNGEAHPFIEPSRPLVTSRYPQTDCLPASLRNPCEDGSDQLAGDIAAAICLVDPHTDQLEIGTEVVMNAPGQADTF